MTKMKRDSPEPQERRWPGWKGKTLLSESGDRSFDKCAAHTISADSIVRVVKTTEQHPRYERDNLHPERKKEAGGGGTDNKSRRR